MQTGVILLGLLLIGCSVSTNAVEDIDYAQIESMAQELSKAAKAGDYQLTMRTVRDIVKGMPAENVKLLGIDVNAWTLKIGKATYLDGVFTDITLTPFWPSMRNYAHILHNPKEHVDGVGYVRGSMHMTRETAVHSMFRQKDVPDVATKVIAYGKGDINVDGLQPTTQPCNRLEEEWEDIVDERGEQMDSKTMLVLTSEYYCPEKLRDLVGGMYREVELTSGYANDGTPVDIVSTLAPNTEHEERSDASELGKKKRKKGRSNNNYHRL